ncbi:Sec39 domain-containing protein [Cadophora sp. MPI-SDFR-AT-0126]|nr:Sec39 domain-containing protein [Leotiomycetes sp. MPI-SDFR-AT-0126]
MAESEIPPAKTVLLAVQLASKGQIPALRSLISLHRKTLHTELVLRILLSYLPETLDSSEYVTFLGDLEARNWPEESTEPLDFSSLSEISEGDAKKKVRKLRLLPLLWPNAPEDAPTDPLVLFLIHRSLRIDQSTGLITQLPELLVPFLHHSDYLRTWMISTILPLLRLNYEYHSDEGTVLTIPKFESLDDHAGVALLLSKTGNKQASHAMSDHFVGRDLKGLVGPWMYGNSRTKRRKLRKGSTLDLQAVEPLKEPSATDHKYLGWEEVFKWMLDQAGTTWRIAVEAVEQWDGPGDVDLGGYEDGTMWLDEDDQEHLEARFARAVLATAYLISEESKEALDGVQRILMRIIELLDYDRIPTLQAACALLTPVPDLDGNGLLAAKNASYLRNSLLDDQNPLTSPKEDSIKLLHALLISAFLCTRANSPMNIRRAGELAIVQDEHEQKLAFTNLMHHFANGPKGDDKYWIRTRNEILWLRGWGAEELSINSATVKGRGIFGQVTKEFIEVEVLKSLLANTRYTLARSIYEVVMDPPLPKEVLHDAIVSAAKNAYDNATNANKTRGGMKKCDDILQTFPGTLKGSTEYEEMEHLVRVTHEVGKYRLVFKQGEPFRPVNLRVHSDPISIIGKILDQNPKSYTQIGDFLEMGKNMVLAGLTKEKAESGKPAMSLAEQKAIAEKRIVSMCIDAALAEDDFETAYSYVVTRLKDIGGPAHARSPDLERKKSGLFAEAPPKVLDDWSWRASLQAGKYERTSNTVKPTHLGNTSGNVEIRHLEQRMDCLSQALRLAPKATLQEILNVYRRCEEKLEQFVKEEAKIEAAWDEQGDENLMPGGFAATPMKNNTTPSTSRAVEEAPMSLFDLSRASMARAQSGFSALSMVRGGNSTRQEKPRPESRGSAELSRVSTPDSASLKAPMRKRDQLKNVAVGGLASGVGWLLGAPPVNHNEDEARD